MELACFKAIRPPLGFPDPVSKAVCPCTVLGRSRISGDAELRLELSNETEFRKASFFHFPLIPVPSRRPSLKQKRKPGTTRSSPRRPGPSAPSCSLALPSHDKSCIATALPSSRRACLLPALKADPVAHRRASQPRLAVPHDLVSGVRIVLAGAISAEMGDEPHGVSQPVRRGQAVLVGVAGQEVQLVTREHHLRPAVGHLAAEQGHHHDAPGDDGVDGNRPLQPVGGAEQQELGTASGFEHAEKVLDPPSLEIEAHDLGRVLGGPVSMLK